MVYNRYMKQLTDIRNNKKIKRCELATMINMRYSNYCTIERSEDELTLENIIALATELNVPFYELIDNESTRKIAKTIRLI